MSPLKQGESVLMNSTYLIYPSINIKGKVLRCGEIPNNISSMLGETIVITCASGVGSLEQHKKCKVIL